MSKIEKAYKFRIYPNKQQEELIQKTFGCCRFVYNYFLLRRKEAYETHKETLNCNVCSIELTKLKNEYEWLKYPDKFALQSSLKDLDYAYKNFFRGSKKGQTIGYPKFKSKKNRYKSYKTKFTNNNIEILERQIKLPKLGIVKCAVSKQIEGRILNATVSQNPSGKYFVSVCCTDVEIQQYESTDAAVGIDLGLKSIAITSDDMDYPNNKYLAKSQKKLAKAQRQLSRKQIGSKNRDKARIAVARLHERVANQRLDSIHKMTTELVQNYDIICIEDLNVKGMTKNHKLAKAINDAAWGEIRRQLTYKMTWQHKNLIVVDRFFPSSQLCQCGYKNLAVKDLSVRYWICSSCGKEHDRDKNAAINILNEGLRLLNIQ